MPEMEIMNLLCSDDLEYVAQVCDPALLAITSDPAGVISPTQGLGNKIAFAINLTALERSSNVAVDGLEQVHDPLGHVEPLHDGEDELVVGAPKRVFEVDVQLVEATTVPHGVRLHASQQSGVVQATLHRLVLRGG